MTVTVLALLGGAAAGRLCGGRLRHVAGHPLRSVWVLAVGFVLMQASGRVAVGAAATVVSLAGYACLLGFVARNPTLAGMGIVAVGLVANAAVIGINGGMPVRPAAVVAARLAPADEVADVDYGRLHHAQSPGDHLVWLDDRIPVPELHQVLSFGDLVIAMGVADVVAHLCQPRRRRTAGPRPSGSPPVVAAAATPDTHPDGSGTGPDPHVSSDRRPESDVRR